MTSLVFTCATVYLAVGLVRQRPCWHVAALVFTIWGLYFSLPGYRCQGTTFLLMQLGLTAVFLLAASLLYALFCYLHHLKRIYF